MNPYQQQRLRRSEALILLHCQLMRRPRPHSMWGLLCQQIHAALSHLVSPKTRRHGRRLDSASTSPLALKTSGVETSVHG